jgi:predicted DNA-binding ribbon-helix-helix protein
MSVITLRLLADKHERLRQIAKQRGISVNRLLDEVTTSVLAQHDAEARFRAAAARGSSQRGVAILDALDRHYAKKPEPA